MTLRYLLFSSLLVALLGCSEDAGPHDLAGTASPVAPAAATTTPTIAVLDGRRTYDDDFARVSFELTVANVSNHNLVGVRPQSTFRFGGRTVLDATSPATNLEAGSVATFRYEGMIIGKLFQAEPSWEDVVGPDLGTGMTRTERDRAARAFLRWVQQTRETNAKIVDEMEEGLAFIDAGGRQVPFAKSRGDLPPQQQTLFDSLLARAREDQEIKTRAALLAQHVLVIGNDAIGLMEATATQAQYVIDPKDSLQISVLTADPRLFALTEKGLREHFQAYVKNEDWSSADVEEAVSACRYGLIEHLRAGRPSGTLSAFETRNFESAREIILSYLGAYARESEAQGAPNTHGSRNAPHPSHQTNGPAVTAAGSPPSSTKTGGAVAFGPRAEQKTEERMNMLRQTILLDSLDHKGSAGSCVEGSAGSWSQLRGTAIRRLSDLTRVSPVSGPDRELRRDDLRDGWGTEFRFVPVGGCNSSFVLWSAGPNRIFDVADPKDSESAREGDDRLLFRENGTDRWIHRSRK